MKEMGNMYEKETNCEDVSQCDLVSKCEDVTKQIKINNNIEILKRYFPSCFDKDGNFNLEKFEEEIRMNEINLSKESYSLEWLGKSYARVLAFEPARTLLREDEEWNGKPENRKSENILIKGDNLEVLKHLVNAYREKIKMIYIDPPYNTGNDGFVYKDDRKFTVKELAELAGIDEERAKRILDFVSSKSNSHSAWLTFMYPRLYIARRLLREDGVIFVSIDDNEVAQLRILMDEIFGEENFLYQLTVVNNLNGNDNSSGMMETHEYCLIYAKDKNKFEFGVLPIDDEKELEKWQIDEKGYYKEGGSLKATGINAPREKRPNLFFPIYINKQTLDFSLEKKDGYDYELLPITEGKEMSWYWSKEKFLRDKDEVIVKRTRDGYSLYKKQRPALGDLPSKRGKTTFYSPSYSMANSNAYIRKLFSEKVFDYPKPIELIKDFIRLANTSKKDIILDFFAGSGTTGDAVMQLNAEDGGNRKFILVQLDEPIDPEKSKTAYDFVKNELGEENPTIFHICRERLVRAAKKIKEEIINKKIEEKENKIKQLESQLDVNEDRKEKIEKLKQEIEALKNQDLGFKIFETIPIWEDYLADEKELTEQTNLFDESKLTDEDLKALLITWKTYDGLPLTEECKEIKLNDYTAYYCGPNLYLLHSDWKTENIKALLEMVDNDKDFVVDKIIVFGYNFTSKHLREIEENIRNYSNKKQIEIETIIRF